MYYRQSREREREREGEREGTNAVIDVYTSWWTPLCNVDQGVFLKLRPPVEHGSHDSDLELEGDEVLYVAPKGIVEFP